MPLPLSEEALNAVTQALQQGNKIEAIKLYRNFTGLGLKDSKDAVEDSERATLELIIQKNACLRTRPDDTLSADYLAGQREQPSDRLEKTVREIAATEEKLSRLDSTYKEHLPSEPGANSGPVLLDHRRSDKSETPAPKPPSKG
jgi:hypothetical protein